MAEFGPTVVRISCFGYAKNIPIKHNYKRFVEVFEEIFEINRKIENLKFDLYFYKIIENNGVRYVKFDLKNEETYKIAFTSENNMKMQFSEVTGKAIFEGSSIEDKTKKSDEIIKANKVLNVKTYNNNSNYNTNNNNIKKNNFFNENNNQYNIKHKINN